MISLTQIKFIGSIAIVALLIFGTIKVMTWREKAGLTDKLAESIAEGNAANKKNEDIGSNLNEGLNLYDTESKRLDETIRVVPDQPRFDPDSVRRTEARISAGIAARERASQMP